MPFIRIEQLLGGVGHTFDGPFDSGTSIKEIVGGEVIKLAFVDDRKVGDFMLMERSNGVIEYPRTLALDRKSRLIPRRVIACIDQDDARGLQLLAKRAKDPIIGGMYQSAVAEVLARIHSDTLRDLGLSTKIPLGERVLGIAAVMAADVPFLFAKR